MALEDWKLLVESSTDGTGKFFPVPHANLESVTFEGDGRYAPAYEREADGGRMIEVNGSRQTPRNSATITLPEDEALHLQNLQRRNCVTDMQRENCEDGRIEHFVGVRVGGQSVSKAVQRGVDAQSGVSLVALPIRFGNIQRANREPVTRMVVVPSDDYAEFIAAVYCGGCETCGDECPRLWRLYKAMNIEDWEYDAYLEYSDDDGMTWHDVNMIDSMRRHNWVDMTCDNGRIYLLCGNAILSGDDHDPVYFSSDARCVDFAWADPPADDGTFFLTNSQRTGIEYTAPVGFDERARFIIAINDGDSAARIWRRVGDNSWTQVYAALSPMAGGSGSLVKYISSAGRVVVAAGEMGRVIYSTNGGGVNTWLEIGLFDGTESITAIAVYTPYRLRPADAVAIISTDKNRVYKIALPRLSAGQVYDCSTPPADVPPFTCDTPQVTRVIDACSAMDGIEQDMNTDTASIISILNGRGFVYGLSTGGSLLLVYDTGDGKPNIGFLENPLLGGALKSSVRVAVCDNDHVLGLGVHGPSAWGAKWWTGSPVAVYQPKGAPSGIDSRLNIVDPSRYKATPILSPCVALMPAFDTNVGWTFSENNILGTGIVPRTNQSWTILVRAEYTTTSEFVGTTIFAALHTGQTAASNGYGVVGIFGRTDRPAAKEFVLDAEFLSGGYVTNRIGDMPVGSLTYAIRGGEGYSDIYGTSVIPTATEQGSYSIDNQIYIGGLVRHDGGGCSFLMEGNIAAMAIYDTVLSDADVLTMISAMNSL